MDALSNQRSAPEYKRAKELVQKLSAMVEENKALKELFVLNGLFFWPSYTQNFFKDANNWLEGKEKPKAISASTKSELLRISTLSLMTFLYSLASCFLARLFKIDTAIFTTNKVSHGRPRDLRIEAVYQAFNERGKVPLEIVHATPSFTAVLTLFKRKTFWIHLECFDVLAMSRVIRKRGQALQVLKSIHFNGQNEEENTFLREMILKYAGFTAVSEIRMKMLVFAFSCSGLKTIFGIDDARHWAEVLSAASSLNAPFYAVQHGHFTKYHIGWLDFFGTREAISPTKLLVWSPYWKDELIRLGSIFSADDILVAGMPYQVEVAYPQLKDGLTTVLLPYENEAPKSVVKKVIERLIDMEGVKVIFKIRPDQEEEGQLREYGLWPKPEGIRVVVDLGREISEVDVALGTYSTLLYEMVSNQVPVGIIDSDFDYGEGMVKNGLAGTVDPDNLPADLKSLADMAPEALKARREKLLGPEKKMLKDTILSIIDQHASKA